MPLGRFCRALAHVVNVKISNSLFQTVLALRKNDHFMVNFLYNLYVVCSDTTWLFCFGFNNSVIKRGCDVLVNISSFHQLKPISWKTIKKSCKIYLSVM